MTKNGTFSKKDSGPGYNKTYSVRGKWVMFDNDVAKLYKIKTGSLNLIVRRNGELFAGEYAFQLSGFEYESMLRKNLVKKDGRHIKIPFMYTWQGICLVSFMLNTRIGLCVHLELMRAFEKTKKLLAIPADTFAKMQNIERDLMGNDEEVRVIFTAVQELLKHK